MSYKTGGTIENGGVNWSHIDLESPCEQDLELIDGLTFEAFLLEINCNIQNINVETVTAEFNEDLNNRIREARSIFAANVKNIVEYAKKNREE